MLLSTSIRIPYSKSALLEEQLGYAFELIN